MVIETQEMTLEFLHKLASDLFFELDDEQCEKLVLEFKAIQEQMEIVIKINTDNIEPLHYPFPFYKNYLREDEVTEPLAVSDILKTAPETQEGYVVINQVIQNEN